MGTGTPAKPKVLSDEELNSSALDLVGYVSIFVFIYFLLILRSLWCFQGQGITKVQS